MFALIVLICSGFVPHCLDFVWLAFREHHKKRDKIKALRRKAADKNPDEFYFNMVSTEKVVCIDSIVLNASTDTL